MTFELDVAVSIGDFAFELQCSSDAPILALFGRSGCGKTSLLNAVAGVLRPDRGRIAIGGRVLFDSAAGISLKPERRGCGYIFQDGRLFPHLTVRQNLRYGLELRGEEPALISFEDMVALLEIGRLLDRRPSTLSGGEAQRVAIGRALMASPRVLLMDEPLTFLDEANQEGIFTVIAELTNTIRIPILYVSHDRAELERLGAHVFRMERNSAAGGGEA